MKRGALARCDRARVAALRAGHEHADPPSALNARLITRCILTQSAEHSDA
jgi:hypothetical protein